MSLINRVLRQVEAEQRCERPLLRIAEPVGLYRDEADDKKPYVYTIIALCVVLVLGFVAYEGFLKQGRPLPSAADSLDQADPFLGKKDVLPEADAEYGGELAASEDDWFAEGEIWEEDIDSSEQPVIEEAFEADPLFVAVQDPEVLEADPKGSEKKPGIFVPANSLSPDALNNAGLLYLESENFTQARKFFKEALSLDPDNEKAMNNMGLSFYMEGSYEKAVMCFERALEINPQNIETYGNLGIVFRKTAQHTRADQIFRKALSINPEHPEVLYNYALLLEDIQLKEASRAYLEKFLRVAPEELKNLKEKVKKYLEFTKQPISGPRAANRSLVVE